MRKLKDEKLSADLRSSHISGSQGQNQLVVELYQGRMCLVLSGKELKDSTAVAGVVRGEPLGGRIVATMDNHAVAH